MQTFLQWVDTLPPWRVELAVLFGLLFLMIVAALLDGDKMEE